MRKTFLCLLLIPCLLLVGCGKSSSAYTPGIHSKQEIMGYVKQYPDLFEEVLRIMTEDDHVWEALDGDSELHARVYSPYKNTFMKAFEGEEKETIVRFFELMTPYCIAYDYKEWVRIEFYTEVDWAYYTVAALKDQNANSETRERFFSYLKGSSSQNKRKIEQISGSKWYFADYSYAPWYSSGDTGNYNKNVSDGVQ